MIKRAIGVMAVVAPMISHMIQDLRRPTLGQKFSRRTPERGPAMAPTMCWGAKLIAIKVASWPRSAMSFNVNSNNRGTQLRGEGRKVSDEFIKN